MGRFYCPDCDARVSDTSLSNHKAKHHVHTAELEFSDGAILQITRALPHHYETVGEAGQFSCTCGHTNSVDFRTVRKCAKNHLAVELIASSPPPSADGTMPISTGKAPPLIAPPRASQAMDSAPDHHPRSQVLDHAHHLSLHEPRPSAGLITARESHNVDHPSAQSPATPQKNRRRSYSQTKSPHGNPTPGTQRAKARPRSDSTPPAADDANWPEDDNDSDGSLRYTSKQKGKGRMLVESDDEEMDDVEHVGETEIRALDGPPTQLTATFWASPSGGALLAEFVKHTQMLQYTLHPFRAKLLLICTHTDCERAVPFSKLAVHLKKHNLDVTKGLIPRTLKAIRSTASHFCHQSIEDFFLPHGSLAIPHIKILHDGAQCSNCQKAFQDSSAAARHRKAIVGCKDAIIIDTPTQSLNPPGRNPYFAVSLLNQHNNHALPNPDAQLVLSTLMQQHAAMQRETAESLAVRTGLANSELAHVLKYSRWPEMLGENDYKLARQKLVLPTLAQAKADGGDTNAKLIVVDAMLALIKAGMQLFTGTANATHPDFLQADTPDRLILSATVVEGYLKSTTLEPISQRFIVGRKPIDRYARHWAAFIIASSFPSESEYDLMLDEKSAAIGKQIYEWASEAAITDPEQDAAPLRKLIRQFSNSILRAPMVANVILNPSLRYFALIALTPNGAFDRAANISSNLVGSIWCLRFFFAIEHFWNHLDLPFDESFALFKTDREKLLLMSSTSNFPNLARTFSYVKAAGNAAGGTANLTWSPDCTFLVYIDQMVKIEDLKQQVNHQIGNLRTMLVELLLLDPTSDLPPLNTSQFFDVVGNTTPALSLSSQLAALVPEEHSLLYRISAAPSLTARFLNITAGEIRWVPHEARSYLELVQSFLETLAVFAHFASGMPARQTEMYSIPWQNTAGCVRGVFLHFGQIMLVTVYNKSNSKTGRSHVVPRFLPRSASRVVTLFFGYVWPLYQLLHTQIFKQPISPFLFAQAGSPDPWDGNSLTCLIADWSAAAIGAKLTALKSRHIIISIFNVLLSQHVKDQIYDDDDFEEDDDDDDNPDSQPAEALQAGHGAAVHRTYYGLTTNETGSLNTKSIRAYYEPSNALHQFYGFDDTPDSMHDEVQPAAPQQPISTAAVQYSRPNTALPSTHTNIFAPSYASSSLSSEVLQTARDVIGPNFQSFASVEQRQALQTMASRQSPYAFVFATGGGKSLLFQAYAMLSMNDGKFTLLVAPYIALVEDILLNLAQKRISAEQWKDRSCTGDTRIVVTTIDRAVSPAFKSWLWPLNLSGKLAAIVYDEVHTAFTESSYRDCMYSVAEFKDYSVPLYYLSATIPPSLLSDLLGVLELSHLPMIRGRTARRNISYRVDRYPGGEQKFDEWALGCINNVHLAAGRKGIIFVKTKTVGEELAKTLGCELYSAESKSPTPSDEDLQRRRAKLANWQAGADPWIVSTTAGGTGVSFDNVDYAIHYQSFYSIINFMQESGRIGRKGQLSTSLVLYNPAAHEFDRSNDSSIPLHLFPRQVLVKRQYLADRSLNCRQSILTRFTDGEGTTCFDDGTSAKCDYCERQVDKPRSRFDAGARVIATEVAHHFNALTVESDACVEGDTTLVDIAASALTSKATSSTPFRPSLPASTPYSAVSPADLVADIDFSAFSDEEFPATPFVKTKNVQTAALEWQRFNRSALVVKLQDCPSCATAMHYNKPLTPKTPCCIGHKLIHCPLAPLSQQLFNNPPANYIEMRKVLSQGIEGAGCYGCLVPYDQCFNATRNKEMLDSFRDKPCLHRDTIPAILIGLFSRPDWPEYLKDCGLDAALLKKMKDSPKHAIKLLAGKHRMWTQDVTLAFYVANLVVRRMVEL